jgi:hypothetical protein
VLPLTHFLRLIRGVMLRGQRCRAVAGRAGAARRFTAVMMTLGDPALPQAPGLAVGSRSDKARFTRRSAPQRIAHHLGDRHVDELPDQRGCPAKFTERMFSVRR